MWELTCSIKWTLICWRSWTGLNSWLSYQCPNKKLKRDRILLAYIESKTYKPMKSRWKPFSTNQLPTCYPTRARMKILTIPVPLRRRDSSQRPWSAAWGSPTWTFHRTCHIWRTRRRLCASKCVSRRSRSPKASIKSEKPRGKPTSLTGRNRRFWRTRRACQSQWLRLAVDHLRTTTRTSSGRIWRKSIFRAWPRQRWKGKLRR